MTTDDIELPAEGIPLEQQANFLLAESLRLDTPQPRRFTGAMRRLSLGPSEREAAAEDLSGAVDLRRQLLRLRERQYGASHPTTLTTTRGLATLLRSQGSHSEAVAMGQQLLSRLEVAYGRDDPRSLRAAGDLAATFRAHGQVAQAKELLLRVAQQLKPGFVTDDLGQLTETVKGLLARLSAPETDLAPEEKNESYGLTTGMLRFQASAPAPNESTREFQSVGTIELLRCLNEDPEWIDLLCMARQGHRYTVLPIALQAPDPEEEGDSSDDDVDDDSDESFALESSELVLHRSDGATIDAQALRACFERDNGVVGAFTESGMGVFVSLIFDLS